MIVRDKNILQQTLSKHNLIVSLSLLAVVVLTSLYTVLGVGMKMSAVDMTRISGTFSMEAGSGMSMANEDITNAGNIGMDMFGDATMGWTLRMALMMFLMWWFMMIAMMTPSAAPTLLLYHNLKRMGPEGDKALPYTYMFLIGYLIIWLFFSILACALQFLIEVAELSNKMTMQLSSLHFSAGLLILAGVYQFTSLKHSCLDKCRSPEEFLYANNRKGAIGALSMGAHHGVFCLGCCWALMALLFVGGVMNLYWITGLALYVAFEKLNPSNAWVYKVMGVALIGLGVALLV